MKNKILKISFIMLALIVGMLILGNTKAYAAEYIVTTPAELNERLFYTSALTEDNLIQLGRDISTDEIDTGTKMSAYVRANLTIDLKGNTLTIDDKDLYFSYYGPYTVKIIDTSDSGNGKIVITRTSNGGIRLDMVNSNSWNGTSKFVLDGIDIEKTTKYAGVLFIFPEEDEANKFDVTIKNTNFTNYLEPVGYNSPNNNLDIRFEPTTTITASATSDSVRLLDNSDDYNNFIDTAKSKVMVKETSTSIERELDLDNETTWNSFYSIRIVPKGELFEVTAPTFDAATYGYSSITAKPISIKAIGVDRTIQNVTVDKTDEFQVLGTGALVTAGSTNTGFTIKPKDGLSAGTHTATITVKDTDNNSYTTTVTFVVNKAKLTQPRFTSYTTPFTYDGNPKSVTVTGYDDTKMTETGSKTGTDANDYSVIYSLLDTANYEWVDDTDNDVVLNWKINKANLSLGVTLEDWIFENTAKTPNITGNESGNTETVEYKVKGAEDSTYTTTVPTNAGEYTVRVRVAESTNYNFASATANFKINKKEIGISSESLDNKVFDDTTTIDPSLIHITLNDTNATFNVTGTSSSKYVGTGIATTLVVTLTDEAYENYTFASNNKTYTITHITHNITPASRDFGNTTSSSSKYPVARGNNIDLKTLITPSSVDLNKVSFAITSGKTGTTLSGSTLNVANDGELGDVTVTATYAGIDKNDDGTNEYEETTTTIYINVVDKTVITISGLTFNDKTYDGVEISPNGELNASHSYNAANLECKYVGTGSTSYDSEDAPFQAGTYRYICSVPASDPNYMGTQTWDFTINKADPTCTAPTGLTAVVGVRLHIIPLPSGFAWETADTTLTAGTHTFVVKFTPTDTTNYNEKTGINVSVYVKNKFNLITNVNSGIGGTISAYKAGVVEGNKETVIFTPDTGYQIAKVLVNSDERTVSDNKLELTMDMNYTVEVFYEKIPYTLDIKTNANATITPTGTQTVNYGDSKDITIVAKHGYKLISVKVNDVEKIADMSGNTLTLSSITANTTVKVEVAKITYNVVAGKDQSFDLKDGITSFVVKADGEYLEFSHLLIDDEEVNGTLYNVTEGSTIVTFNDEGLNFLKGLNIGKHTLTFVYEDGGVATTNFTIKDTTKADDNTSTEINEDNNTSTNTTIKNPTTYDNGIFGYTILSIVSGLALIGLTFKFKKQSNK